MYSLNMTMLYIYIHRHSLIVTLSIITYYVIIFLLACGINFSNLYKYFTQREVLYFTINTILYYSVCCINVQLNFLMVYSPLLINSSKYLEYCKEWGGGGAMW